MFIKETLNEVDEKISPFEKVAREKNDELKTYKEGYDYSKYKSIINGIIDAIEFIETAEKKIKSEDEILKSYFETTKENLSLHPELLKFDKLFRTIEQSELLNQKESSPMIGFGLDYINVSERPDINFIDNGKDIIMPMISLSIPIFNKKYKSITKQNELEQQEILYQKKEKRNTLETLLNKALKERMSARISYNTAIKNIKQANNAKQILIKNYETGAIDFIDVLDLQELELKFQINQIESIVKYYVQSTIINYLSN